MTDKELIKQEIKRRYKEAKSVDCFTSSVVETTLDRISDFIDSLSEEPASEDLDIVMDNAIMYASREAGIESFAETYSFNIESELFDQLTKEQQELWRKEIEQACISGGEMGLELANDKRYDERELSEDLEEEIENYIKNSLAIKFPTTDKEQIKADIRYIARHFAEWQKQQMMKNALLGRIIERADGLLGWNTVYGTDVDYRNYLLSHFKNGDKVKIIIVKNEQQ